MRTVRFVCVHNAGRSQMDEAFFNHAARQRGLDARAGSARTAPGRAVDPVAVEAMREPGIGMDGRRPKLTPGMAAAADRIIMMGRGVEAEMCPASTYISEDQGLPDPHGQSLETVRPVQHALRERVLALVDELGAGA